MTSAICVVVFLCCAFVSYSQSTCYEFYNHSSRVQLLQSNVGSFGFGDNRDTNKGVVWPRGGSTQYIFGAGIIVGYCRTRDTGCHQLVMRPGCYSYHDAFFGGGKSTPYDSLVTTCFAHDPDYLTEYHMRQTLYGYSTGELANTVVIETTIRNEKLDTPMTDCVIGYVINEEIGTLSDIVNAIAGDHCQYLSSINGNPVYKAWSDKGADGTEFGSFGVLLMNTSTRQGVNNVQQFEYFSQDRSLWFPYETLLQDTLEDSSTDTNLVSLFALPPIQIGPGDSTTVALILSFTETNSAEGDIEILNAMERVLGISDVDEGSSAHQLDVYPQPLVHGEALNIRSARTIESVNMYDLIGRHIYTLKPHTSSAVIEGLEKGVYLLNIEHDIGEQIRQLVVVD